MRRAHRLGWVLVLAGATGCSGIAHRLGFHQETHTLPPGDPFRIPPKARGISLPHPFHFGRRSTGELPPGDPFRIPPTASNSTIPAPFRGALATTADGPRGLLTGPAGVEEAGPGRPALIAPSVEELEGLGFEGSVLGADMDPSTSPGRPRLLDRFRLGWRRRLGSPTGEVEAAPVPSAVPASDAIPGLSAGSGGGLPSLPTEIVAEVDPADRPDATILEAKARARPPTRRGRPPRHPRPQDRRRRGRGADRGCPDPVR